MTLTKKIKQSAQKSSFFAYMKSVGEATKKAAETFKENAPRVKITISTNKSEVT